MCYYTSMERNTKIAIGVGAGFLIWRKFGGILAFGMLICAIIVVWAVVDPEVDPGETKAVPVLKQAAPKKYVIDPKRLRADLELTKNYEASLREGLKWAVTADLDAVINQAMKTRSDQPKSREIFERWVVECREAVKINSIENIGATWCETLKDMSEDQTARLLRSESDQGD